MLTLYFLLGLLILGAVGAMAAERACKRAHQAEIAYWADFQHQLNLENQAMRQRWAREDAERALIPVELPQWEHTKV